MSEQPTLARARVALADGSLSPEDLLDACLARVDASEPRVKAWVALDPAGARAQVRALDPAGRDDPGAAPLWGIPLGIKDVIDVAGLPTTASSKVLAGNVPAADAPVVRRLRAAGAVILGKTNTQEFAYGVVSPPTTNPWDPERIPGGSSGGSAAAVAAGHCPGAMGSDTAGSVRIPAALCGVVGLKPRPGVVPVAGVVPLAPSFDAVGPIGPTVEDVAFLWQALAGGPRVREAGPGLEVGLPPPGALPELTPGVAAAFDHAVAVLGDVATFVPVPSCPPFSAFDEHRGPVLMWEALTVHREGGWWPARAADYTDETRSNLERAERSLDEAAVTAARRACAALAGRLVEAVGAHGLLATPAVPCEAPTHEEAARVDAASARRPLVRQLTRIPGPVNAAGLAALTLPCGLGDHGLPVGLQLIGGDEPTVISAGLAFERALAGQP